MSAPGHGGTTPPLRVFLVDDEAPARERMREVLGDLGAELPNTVVGEATNGHEALLLIREEGLENSWARHQRHHVALKAGLEASVAEDLAQGRRPAAMQAEEAAIYDFCTELHRDKAVSEPSFRAALECFGERGVADLMGICGYYTLVSMVLNVDRHPLPEGVRPPLR